MNEQDERKELPEMITTKQAADLLGVSPQRVRVLAEAGRIKARKFGRLWMIDRDSVLAFEPLPPHRPPQIGGSNSD